MLGHDYMYMSRPIGMSGRKLKGRKLLLGVNWKGAGRGHNQFFGRFQSFAHVLLSPAIRARAREIDSSVEEELSFLHGTDLPPSCPTTSYYLSSFLHLLSVSVVGGQ